MTVPIHCHKCGALIGKAHSLDLGFDVSRNCCSHAEPQATETKMLFGLIKRTRVEYLETRTSSFCDEYAGPPNKFMLWLTIGLAGGDGVLVNQKWVWWDLQNGFFGDGFEEFKKLQEKSG